MTVKQFTNFLRYVPKFIKELVLANYQVVKLVLSPQLKIKPGFIAVPMKAKGDWEVTWLANSITLTPGTVSVHIPDDRHTIVVHALDIGDGPESVRASVQNALEAPILAFTRADGAGSAAPPSPSNPSSTSGSPAIGGAA